jgi:hypothetical protein
MTATNLAKPALLMAFFTIIAVVSWECYLRQQGIAITYDDSAELWADKRSKVYKPASKATVFIGSSRIKYDLDIATWQQQTGKEAIQLAIEGNSPLTILEDLGNDPEFKGNLVVDVTEILYYNFTPDVNKEPQGYIKYYHDQTYAQKAGFELNYLLESQLVFLNKKFLSLKAQLDNLPVSDRDDVPLAPKFPMDFINVNFERQTHMNSKFLSNPSQKKQVTDTWAMIIGMINNAPPPTENPIPKVLKISKGAVDKIRSRGGNVVFVRTPSSGPFLETEQKIFVRPVFWDGLLAATNSRGIHFMDYPAISNFDCPEWSHLSPEQSVEFTTQFIKLLPSSFTK